MFLLAKSMDKSPLQWQVIAISNAIGMPGDSKMNGKER
jgi:hypothetical protein